MEKRNVVTDLTPGATQKIAEVIDEVVEETSFTKFNKENDSNENDTQPPDTD